jgi:hypothetical protein
VLINTNAGYAFFWANHPIYGAHFVPILTPEMGTYQSLIPQELHHWARWPGSGCLRGRCLSLIGAVYLLFADTGLLCLLRWFCTISNLRYSTLCCLSYGLFGA